MRAELPTATLIQSLALGLALGLGWGASQAWPRDPVMVPGVVTTAQADPLASPLPRFVGGASEAVRHPQRARLALESPRAWERGSAGAPADPGGAPISAAGSELPEQPASGPPPGAGALTELDRATPTDPEHPAVPAHPAPGAEAALAEADLAFDQGYELYRRFVIGEGDRTSTARAARAQLEHCRDALERALAAAPLRRREIEQRLDQCVSYLGFLIHYAD